VPLFVVWKKQYQSRQPYEHANQATERNRNFHDDLLG
jgi:hypothetical protein